MHHADARDQGTSAAARFLDGNVNNMGNSNSARKISAQDKCVFPIAQTHQGKSAAED